MIDFLTFNANGSINPFAVLLDTCICFKHSNFTMNIRNYGVNYNKINYDLAVPFIVGSQSMFYYK